MKNKVLLITPILALISACQNGSPVGRADCIQPCQTKTTSDKEISGKLSASLNAINASGSAEAQYKNVIEADYSALSDKNCLLVIGMRAIECYKKQGIIDKATAQSMAQDALKAWRDALGNGGRSRATKVSNSELKLIDQSSQAGYIRSALAAHGLIRN